MYIIFIIVWSKRYLLALKCCHISCYSLLLRGFEKKGKKRGNKYPNQEVPLVQLCQIMNAVVGTIEMKEKMNHYFPTHLLIGKGL